MIIHICNLNDGIIALKSV